MSTSRIRAEVRVDNHIIVPRNRKSVKVEAMALVHNDSDEHFVLSAADSASAHGWQILDAQGREIARHAPGASRTPRGATAAICSTMIPSRHSVQEHEVMEVAASKLANGARYVVRHDHWGQVSEAAFVAVHEPVPAAARKTARKKAGKKKAAKKTVKKKAAKKTVKKAAVRKKTAKKTARKRR